MGPAREYLQAGVPLSLGTDGQTFSSILEEARRLEMHERLRLQMRNALPLQESKVQAASALRSQHPAVVGHSAKPGSLLM